MTRVDHLDMLGSDHCPILLDTDATPVQTKRRNRPIRFEALWLRSEQCEEIVRRSWPQYDADEVLCIPLGRGDHEDTLIWHFNASCKFSVRSAHHLALDLYRRNLASSSMTKSYDDWKFLWNRRTPSKVKVFGWRLCTNALPTMQNLMKRNPGVDNVCPVCRTEDEDSKHILLQCPVVRQVWALSDLPWRVIPNWCDDAADWLRHVSSTLEANDPDRALLICWLLWQNRNQCLWGMTGSTAEDIAANSMRILWEYGEYIQSLQQANRTDSSYSFWKAPPEGVIKVNFDGATFAE
ncbi:hypothetical protein Salat_2796300 [Sesamum alatum]|uniref:Reverse transcriptase zinc-binding domain-containing protein n=1 Tax=Sesamum alatum TaxID=300844 RepID=A0AAE1XKY1_9LAMI|nr:hypothetical protein Salat_2796300 [Sesamum alatum]